MAITTANDLLNPSLGLQNILEPVIQNDHLPGARPLATNVPMESTLASFFQMGPTNRLLEEALTPVLPSSELLRPDIFRQNLKKTLAQLKGNRNLEVRRFIREDLAPLIDNSELLNSYVSLLVSG